MLGREVLVLHLFGFFLRLLKDGVCPRTKILLPTRHLWKFLNGGLHLVNYRGSVRTYLAKYRPDDPLFLLEHRGQQVFGFDLLVLRLFGDTDGLLNGLLSPDGKSIESHIFIVDDER